MKIELTKFMSNDPINEEMSSQRNDLNSGSNNISSKALGKVSAKNFNEAKKEKIISIIQEEKSLWIKILKFEKVDLKEIKEIINKKGIIIENEILKEFLSQLGVIFEQQR